MPLSPSQRVVLIKEISDRLSTEDYSLIDVTFKQFSLPWSDQWQGDKNSYVLSMVAEAPDEVLSPRRSGRHKLRLRWPPVML